jgi:RimJ/RimL family protein N-acetyltransferase
LQIREADVNPTDIRIETERLILRPPQFGDFERYAGLLGDAEAARYIGGQLPRAAAWRRFLQMPGAWAVQGFGMFSVVEKASGRWVGQVGPWKPEGWPGNEVGWTFHPDAWGKGYATEAGTVAIDWAFDNLGWDDIIHCIHPDNLASQRLAMRFGSRNKGPAPLPAPYEDSPNEVWGQGRVEWHAHRAGATA